MLIDVPALVFLGIVGVLLAVIRGGGETPEEKSWGDTTSELIGEYKLPRIEMDKWVVAFKEPEAKVEIYETLDEALEVGLLHGVQDEEAIVFDSTLEAVVYYRNGLVFSPDFQEGLPIEEAFVVSDKDPE